jgi:hypothetical protein
MKKFQESLEACMTSSPRDWAANERDAWMWGIIVGWDIESFAELRIKFGWDGPTAIRLINLRNEYMDIGN